MKAYCILLWAFLLLVLSRRTDITGGEIQFTLVLYIYTTLPTLMCLFFLKSGLLFVLSHLCKRWTLFWFRINLLVPSSGGHFLNMLVCLSKKKERAHIHIRANTLICALVM